MSYEPVHRPVDSEYYLIHEVSLIIAFLEKRAAMFEETYKNIINYNPDISCRNITYHQSSLWNDKDRLDMEVDFLEHLLKKCPGWERIINNNIYELNNIRKRLCSVNGDFDDLYEKRSDYEKTHLSEIPKLNDCDDYPI